MAFANWSIFRKSGIPYLFLSLSSGKYVWLYDESDASKTEPLLISEAWPGVTGPIDAALTYPKEHHAYTFLFKVCPNVPSLHVCMYVCIIIHYYCN